MDILEKYDKENPEVLRQDSPWELSEEYSFLVCMVIRLSGGRIQSPQQANYVLVGISVVMIIVTGIILITGFGGITPVVLPSST